MPSSDTTAVFGSVGGRAPRTSAAGHQVGVGWIGPQVELGQERQLADARRAGRRLRAASARAGRASSCDRLPVAPPVLRVEHDRVDDGRLDRPVDERREDALARSGPGRP